MEKEKIEELDIENKKTKEYIEKEIEKLKIENKAIEKEADLLCENNILKKIFIAEEMGYKNNLLTIRNLYNSKKEIDLFKQIIESQKNFELLNQLIKKYEDMMKTSEDIIKEYEDMMKTSEKISNEYVEVLKFLKNKENSSILKEIIKMQEKKEKEVIPEETFDIDRISKNISMKNNRNVKKKEN